MDKKSSFERYVGTTFSGRYKIEKLLGVGGMSVVFRATDMKENRTVAIKMLKGEVTGNEKALQHIENESRAVSLLSHPNIVGIYDVCTEGDVKYLVMEYVEGISLRTYMNKKGALTFEEIASYSEQILAALQHAHSRGVVHRDIKPQNIMLLKNGLVKVTDFGVAKLPDKDTADLDSGEAVGTVYYISPEQAAGKPSDARSDLYSLGVMMYEMATGKLPFDAEQAVSVLMMQINDPPVPPRTLNRKISRGLQTLILGSMEKEPKNRYQSALDMFRELRRLRCFRGAAVLTPKKLKAAKRSERNRAANPPSRSMTPVILGIAYALLFVAVVAAFYVLDNIRLGGIGKASISVPELEGKNYISEDWLRQLRDTDGAAYADFAASFGISVPEETKEDGEKAEALLTQIHTAQLSALCGEGFDVSDYVIDVEYVYSLTYERGTVIEQAPAPGSSRKPGCTVELKVSQGPETLTVMDYTITEWRAAQTALRGQGFIVTVVREENPNVPVGYVIATEPAPGESVIRGTGITIHVSNGSPLASVDIPDFVGLHERTVVQQLEQTQLLLGHAVYTRSSLPPGTILSQSPEAGAIGYTGRTSVDFLVSGGKTFATNYYPDVFAAQYDEAVSLLETYGMEVRYYYVRNGEAPGTVIRQSPDPSTAVGTETDSVILTVSGGPDFVSLVPIYSVVGMDEDTARQLLFYCFENYASVDFKVIYKRSPLPAGEVMEQVPAGKSRVDTGSGSVTVTLTVSGGPDFLPPDVTVIFPDVEGLPAEDAAHELYEAGILVNAVIYERSDLPVGTVLIQPVPAGDSITGPEGMITIDLIVSGGPNFEPTVPEDPTVSG